MLVAPALDVTGTLNLNEGSSTTLAAAATATPGSTISRIEWDNNYNGTTFRPAATGRSFRFNATNNGTRVVAARAIDSLSRVSTVVTRTLTIADVAPTISITSGNTSGEGQAYTLNWRYTDPGNGGNDLVTSWSVNWGDGNTDTFNSAVPKSTLRSAEHAYSTQGSYTVTLTAVQQNGSHNLTRVLAVAQVNPIVTVSTTDISIDEGESAAISFATTNRETSIAGWSIDWGDGESEFAEVGTEELTHIFNEPGVYEVKVKAVEIDEDNLDPASTVGVSSVIITVANAAPEATISSDPTNTSAGDTVNFTSNASDVGGLNEGSFTYAWSVERAGANYDLNGAATDLANFSFVPRTPGTYRATLVVTDPQSGFVTRQSGNFSVANVAPTAVITAPGGGTEGQAINASVAVTDPGTNTHSYTWSVTRNNQPYTLSSDVEVDNATFDFTPQEPGDYKIAVVVDDNWEGSDSDQTGDIVVANVNPTGSVSIDPTLNVSEGDVVVATVDADDAGSTAELTYNWRLYKDTVEVQLPGDISRTGSNFTFVPNDNGSFVARVEISDGQTTVDVDSTALVVANAAPTVTPTRTVQTVLEGQTVNLTSGYFDAGSLDTAGTTTFAWTLKQDGSQIDVSGLTTDQNTFSFVAADNGEYEVTVTATDKDGGVSTASSTTFNVGNVAPTLPSISGIIDPFNEGETLALTFGNSTDVAADTVQYQYRILYNGGTLTPWTTGSSVNFFVPDDGAYLFQVFAFDEDGGESDVESVNGDGLNLNPAVTASTTTAVANEGDSLSFTSSAIDVAADTLTYLWSVTRDNVAFTLPQGTVTNNTTLSFIAPDEGTYEATLSVTDGDGGIDDDNADSTVSNVVPTGTVENEPISAINEGTVVVLTSAITDPGSADVLSYSWTLLKDNNPVTLPPGMVTTGSSFSFTPTDNGTWDAILTVNDGDSLDQTFTSAEIIVNNVAPTTTITQIGEVLAEGTAITVRANPSDVGADDTVFTYAWTLTKDGTAVDVSALTTNARNFTFTPDDNGTYSAEVVVSDKDAGFVTLPIVLNVSNVNPVATIVGAPLTRDENQTVSLSATSTDAGAADTVSYQWRVYRDGSSNAYNLQGASANLASFTFTPREPGSYRVEVTATDDDNGTNVQDSVVEVRNLNPTVNITGTPLTAINEGASVTLTATGNDPGGDANLTYRWSVTRNGQPYSLGGNSTASTSALTFAPNDNGTYRARAEATDEQDGIGAVLSANFIVNNVAPTVAITGAPVNSINEGTVVVLTANVTDAGSADTHTYNWTLRRNGQVVALPLGANVGSALQFVANNEGTWSASVVVTDKDSATGNATSANVAVANVAPTGQLTASVNNVNAEGQLLSFTGTATDPGSDDTITYGWQVFDVNAGFFAQPIATGSGANFSFTPADDGTYRVELLPQDDLGWFSVLSQTVTVTNVAPVPSIVASNNAVEGVAFSAAGSFTDVAADATGATYAWTVRLGGVGAVLESGSAANFSFTPPDDGSYTVQLQVTDDGNATGTTTSVVSVANVAPTSTGVDLDDTTLNQGNTVTFTVNVDDVEADLGGLEYAWQLLLNGSPLVGVTGTQPVFQVTPSLPGNYSARVIVSDGDGGETVRTRDIQVANIAPNDVAVVGDLSAINEGQIVSVTGQATDPAGPTDIGYIWTVRLGDTVVATQNGIALNFTPDQPGSYSIQLTARDSGDLATSEFRSLTVNNLAPVVTDASTVGVTVRPGESNIFAFQWADVGSASTITSRYSLNGASDVVLPVGTATGSFNLPLTFASAGSQTIVFSASDGTASASVTRTVAVSNAFSGNTSGDVFDAAIVITGTSGNDVINVTRTRNNRIRVFTNGVASPDFAIDRPISVFALGGDDRVTINNNLSNDVFISGGDGNDSILTSTGNDFVVGNGGADTIVTGEGRDIVFGSGGIDRIDAGAGEDLVVGSEVISSQNYTTIRNEWTSGNTFANRVARLRQVGLFSNAVINDTTVSVDGARDIITSGTDADWIVSRGSPTDSIIGSTSADNVLAL